MTAIKIGCAGILAVLITGCLEPVTENLWMLNKVAQVETEGYCRDVFISGDSVFVAAGQAGIQLWDISTISAPTQVWEMTLSDLGVSKEIMQVEYEASIKQLFALESNERPIHIDLSQSDSIRLHGQLNTSEKTKEFRVIASAIDTFTVYAADNDDGLKWNKFGYDPLTFDGIWNLTGGAEIPCAGLPNGIDIYEDEIVLTIDQLGIEAFHNQNGQITSSYHIDLDGNARSVTMINGGEFYVACEEGGAYRLNPGSSSQWASETQFAEDQYVTHIAENDHQLVLSCASNGLALYEASLDLTIKERGIHDIGYVYHAEFASGYLFAATREGLQIYEIVE